MFTECSRGITAPKGFQAAGIHCGVKRAKKDLALVTSQAPAVASAVFTTNSVQAAPILVNKIQLRNNSACRAIIINSGNANACTGEKGLQDAWTMVEQTAETLGIPPQEVLIASTGVIGQYLPMEKIVPGIASAVSQLHEDGYNSSAEAIMTTDTFVKQLAVSRMIDGVEVTLGGMAKGSGMIAPNMATMLGFITTDARIAPDALRHALQQAVQRSFNRISVDGDTSTNDMVAILANGLADNTEISDVSGAAYLSFYEMLEYVLVLLSKMIILDGEGATKLVEIHLTGADTEDSAVCAAKAIANSNLFKTAMHGEDANWGRILAALGYSGVQFDPANVEIYFDDVPILQKNYNINFSEERAKNVLSKKEFIITVNLHAGAASASFWTCDLSKEYVAINANYRS